MTQEQINKIQLGAGVTFVDFGLPTEKKLGASRGGGSFTVTATIRPIDFDGSRGKEKGMEVIDDVSAMIKTTLINTSQDILAMALPDSIVNGNTIESGNIGFIPNAKYISNITHFAKTADGNYKKFEIFNALNEKGLEIQTKDKGEGEVALEFAGHWDSLEELDKLYKITEVSSIDAAIIGPIATIDTEPTAAGAGYEANDVLTVASGNGNAKVKVATVDGDGKVLTLTAVPINPGTGYVVGAGQPTVGGNGTGATIEIISLDV